MNNNDAKLITVEQAKLYYNLSRPTIVKMAEANGALIRIGRALRVDVSKLNKVIEDNKIL